MKLNATARLLVAMFAACLTPMQAMLPWCTHSRRTKSQDTTQRQEPIDRLSERAGDELEDLTSSVVLPENWLCVELMPESPTSVAGEYLARRRVVVSRD